jgi:methylamine---glutamate N-methyltransferase subunit C
MSRPKIAEYIPKQVDLDEGKTYAWCSCGLSENQPYCDGSHKVTDHKPIVFKAEKTETVWLCQCKQTKSGPKCDGSHKTLNQSD